MEDFIENYAFQTLAYVGVIVFVGCVYSQWLGKAFAVFWNSGNAPGPISLPFVGSVGFVFDALRRNVNLKSIQSLLKKYKGMFRVVIGKKILLFVSDPADIEELSQSENVSTFSPFFNEMNCEFLGKGFSSENSMDVRVAVKNSYKDILKSFLSKKVNEPNQIILQKCCGTLIENIENIYDENLQNISSNVDRCIADMLSGIFMGNEIMFQNGSMDHVIESCEKIPQMIYDRRSRFWLYDNVYYSMSNILVERYKMYDNISPFIAQIVQKRINFSNGAQIENPNHLIDELLNNYKHIPYGSLVVLREIQNLWNKGMIMICDTMKFFIIMLAMNKNSQNKAVEEMRRFYGNSIDVPVKYEHLKHFPYLKMCLKEVLRLFPQLPVSSKYAVNDFKMKNKDIKIAANTEILFANYVGNRNENFWSNPKSFMPERFANKKFDDMKIFDVFCPFKIYSKDLSNEDWGEQIILTTIIYLFRKYEFESDWKFEQLPIDNSKITKSEWGYKAKITKRIWK